MDRPWICEWACKECGYRINPIWRAQCRICKADRRFFVARPRLRRGI